MKRCGAKGWCTVMEIVLNDVGASLYIVPHKDHSPGVSIRTDNDGKFIDLSLCPWCGASLLPKPIVVKTKFRGKR